MLYGLLIVPLDLNVVRGVEKLGVLAVFEEVLIVQLEVPQHQLVLVCFHRLELKHKRTLSCFYIHNGYMYLHLSLKYCDYCSDRISIILYSRLKSVAKPFSDVKTAESCLLFNSFRRALEGPVIQ